MKNLLFIIFSIYCLFTYSMANQILTIDQAIEMAYKNRPSLKALQYAVQASAQDEKKAMSGYYPQVSMTEQPSFLTGYEGIQNQVGLQATQLIYSFAGPIENYRIAKKATEGTEYDEELHKDNIRYNVEASFIQSWLLQQKNKYIEYLGKSSTETLKQAEHQNKLDLLNKNDWYNNAATYSENMSSVYYYSDQLNNAKNQLEYLIGKQFGNGENQIKLEWDANQEIKLETVEYYYQLALKNRKEIKRKQTEVEYYQEYQNFYKKAYLPNLSLAGNVSRASYGTSSDLRKSNSSIGLNLSWSMFDGGANYSDSQKANANKLKALMEKDSNVQQVRFDVQKAYNDLSIYLKQLVAKNVRLTQAQNEYSLKKLQFKIGEISMVDLETAKYNWESQKFDWLTLKVNAAIKERELFYACGYPQI